MTEVSQGVVQGIPQLQAVDIDDLRRAIFWGESKAFSQPAIDAGLALTREKIARMCFNDASISPESLIRRATAGCIGFLDLYAYHEWALNPRGLQYAEGHPHEAFVSVGLEFAGEGGQQFRAGVVTNTFLINYDALHFLKRLRDSSVRIVNIDFPATGLSRSGGETSWTKAAVSHLKESRRVLCLGGEVSLYVPIEDRPLFKKALPAIGFECVEFPRPLEAATDLLYRRSDLRGEFIRVVGRRA